jgi:hypothetical protein
MLEKETSVSIEEERREITEKETDKAKSQVDAKFVELQQIVYRLRDSETKEDKFSILLKSVIQELMTGN